MKDKYKYKIKHIDSIAAGSPESFYCAYEIWCGNRLVQIIPYDDHPILVTKREAYEDAKHICNLLNREVSHEN